MPKYKNLSNIPISIHSVPFRFNESVEVPFYVDTNKEPFSKIIKEDDLPIYTPVDYSEKVSGGGSCDILTNKKDTSNTIRLVSTTDISEVSFNSVDSPKIVLTSLQVMEIKNIDYYKEIFVHSGTVSVEIWSSRIWV